MKYLIALALCMPLVAHAESMFAQMKSGGRVVITDGSCSINNKSFPELRGAYLVKSDSSFMHACWAYADGMVHVVFSDGDRRAYPIGAFEKSE